MLLYSEHSDYNKQKTLVCYDALTRRKELAV